MTKEEMLERSYFAIEGVRSNPQMVQSLKRVGWTPQETSHGWKLYQEAAGSLREQQEKAGRKFSATDALKQAEQALKPLYRKHLSLARLAVPYERSTYHSLELSGKRKLPRSAWLGQVRSFYANIHLVQSELAAYGVTPEEIAQAQAMIEAVDDARVKQHEARSAAQQARLARDRSYRELDQWTRRFIRAVRFAFDDNPQQLEALGMVVK